MEFEKVVESRYSVRNFKDMPIEEDKLARVLSVVSLAPTACNNQPQKIYVLKSPESREKVKAVCPCTFDAPVILVLAYDQKLAARGRILPHYQFGETDTAIIGTHLMLAAQNEGLGTCWVGWFRAADVSAALNLPENIQVTGLMPIGYPADEAAPGPLHEKSRAAGEMISFL